MPGVSDRDIETCTSIVRNLETTARKCEVMAAGYAADGDTESAVDLHTAALRYRQLAARALGCWADADALASLCANAARDSAWDAETTACAERETEEMPRVH